MSTLLGVSPRACALLSLLALPGVAAADGTETLGPPSIGIGAGTGIAAAGVGLHPSGGPGVILLDVPAGAGIVQVLLYWSGAVPMDDPGDPTLIVEGTEVLGTQISDPAYFFTFGGDFHYTAYRADITALGVVAPGPNAITVEGLDFRIGDLGENSGAGILVIYDDGSALAEIGVRDGMDLAFAGFPDPRRSTVPQTFTFPPADVQRTADLAIFAGSVGGGGRTSIVRVSNEGMVLADFVDMLASVDGDLWDTLTVTVDVPAFASSLTVEIISGDEGAGAGSPASLSWVGAGLSVPGLENGGGGEGCTPGFWRQEHHFEFWTAPYAPSTPFGDVFENAFPGRTLLDIVDPPPGRRTRLEQLGFHTVAALLNAASPDVDYDLTVDEVIDLFNAVFPGTNDDYNDLKDYFEGFNQQGSPICD